MHISRFGKRLRDERGLTLIEILSSMMVFMVVSTGVAGTLTSGLRSAVHTRLQTIGKSVATQQIEEMRSRVFYVPFSDDPATGTTSNVDLLDIYYPGHEPSTATDSQGRDWSGSYTGGGDAHYTMIHVPDPELGTAGPEIAIAVETRFVNNAGATIPPYDSYDSNLPGSDLPPSNLVSVIVTTSWSDRTGDNVYQLDTLISATSQTVRGAGDALGEQGCSSNSTSSVDVTGGMFSAELIDPDVPTVNLRFNAGASHAGIPQTGCENKADAQGKGGQISVTSGGQPVESPQTGADTGMVLAPPDQNRTSDWPSGGVSLTDGLDIDFLSSHAEAEASVVVAGRNESEGEATAGGASILLPELTGLPFNPPSDAAQWNFNNPLLYMIGGSNPAESDPDYADDQVVAHLEQEDDSTTAGVRIYYEDIGLLPLLAEPGVASAEAGLVIIRDFTVTVDSHAGGTSGSAGNELHYSANVGMFNVSTGGYDFYTIDENNALQDVFKIKNNTDYRLQKELFTVWHSYTADELTKAVHASTDNGTTATVSITGGLLNISSRFGLRLEKNGNSVTLLDEKGIEHVQLGVINVSLYQE